MTGEPLTLEEFGLGQLINTPQEFENALRIGLRPFHFRPYQKIFNELGRAFYASQTHDSFSLANLFTELASRIFKMADECGTFGIEYYGKKILAKHAVIEYQAAAKAFHDYCYNWRTDIDFATIEDEKSKLIFALETGGNSSSDFTTLEPKAAMEQYRSEKRNPDLTKVYKTGIPAIDSVHGGIKRGHYICLAGRTSQGKSTLAINIALGVAEDGGKPVYFSIEMSENEIRDSAVAILSGVSYEKVEKPNLRNQGENEWVEAAEDHLEKIEFRVNSNTKRQWERVESEIRRLHRLGKCEFAIVDYIQQFKLLSEKLPRREMLTEISSRAQGIAQELNIPVMVLAQMNREAAFDSKDSTLKTGYESLHMIKECGSLEEDPNLVIQIFEITQQMLNDQIQQAGFTKGHWISFNKARKGARAIQKIDFNKETGSCFPTGYKVEFVKGVRQ